MSPLKNLNTTGSRWEGYVDDVMTKLERYSTDFSKYAKSEEGKKLIAQVQIISTLASAAILAFASPLVVGISTLAGVVVKTFSPEQVKNISDSLGDISSNLPGGVKMLAAVIAVTYAPILFPTTAGLYFGLTLIPTPDPKEVVGVLDHVAGQVKGSPPISSWNQSVLEEEEEESTLSAREIFARSTQPPLPPAAKQNSLLTQEFY